MDPGTIYKDIPMELKEYGRIQIRKPFKDLGFIVIPYGISEREGYFVFRKLPEAFLTNDLIAKLGIQFIGYVETLERAYYIMKEDTFIKGF